MWAPAAIKVQCEKWSRVLGSRVGTSSITATFEQVFEP
jgi:phage-related protein